MLRPSKRLKKQQTAALQALQQQQSATISTISNGVASERSFVADNDHLNAAAKLKSALIGKPVDPFQPLLQQTLFQQPPIAGQPTAIHNSLQQPGLAVSNLAASNLMKRLQVKDEPFPNQYL